MNRFRIVWFFALLSGFVLHAQRGQVAIEQDPEIDRLLDIYKEAKANADYFTIQVGFGSYDYAEELRDELREELPHSLGARRKIRREMVIHEVLRDHVFDSRQIPGHHFVITPHQLLVLLEHRWSPDG